MQCDYLEEAVKVGRPPNIQARFPDSKALIVSGKFINLAMSAANAVVVAANGRSYFVIRAALLAAQKANSAVIIEIAKSECGYCAINFSNIAQVVDKICNELNITIPVAIHADHYTIKNQEDIEKAKAEIPKMFEDGITSIAIDASHLSDAENLLACIELAEYVPGWAGFEVEVGEIKGKEGLSTPAEAEYLAAGLNAHGTYPTWMALNNGTTHGIEKSDSGIQVDLTAEIHEALEPYNINGAQHGTSGNSFSKLHDIVASTNTTKANFATALQFLSWGILVNEYGNAVFDEYGVPIKIVDEGVTEELWNDMKAYASENGWENGDFKKLNLPFEEKLRGLPLEIQDRMVRRVSDFIYTLMTEVLNSKDTAARIVGAILFFYSYGIGFNAEQIEDPDDWTEAKIYEKAAALNSDSDKGPNPEQKVDFSD